MIKNCELNLYHAMACLTVPKLSYLGYVLQKVINIYIIFKLKSTPNNIKAKHFATAPTVSHKFPLHIIFLIKRMQNFTPPFLFSVKVTRLDFLGSIPPHLERLSRHH